MGGGGKVSHRQWGRYVRENCMSPPGEGNGLRLRKELAAEIGVGSTTVKVANETPGALAGWSMARGGRVFLERLGAPPEGVPNAGAGPGHRCLYPGSASMAFLNGHKLFYAARDPKKYTTACQTMLFMPELKLFGLLLFHDNILYL